MDYLDRCRRENKTFEVLMMDIDSKASGAAMSCPPPQFVSDDALDTAAAVLDKSGNYLLSFRLPSEGKVQSIFI